MNTNLDFTRYMEALLEGDARVLDKIIAKLRRLGTDLNTIYDDYIRRSLYEVGRMWESDKISVANEHLTTATTKLVLSDLFFKLECAAPNEKRVVVACVPHEYHDIATIILANVFEENGWKADMLGANTPTEALLDHIGQLKPDTLALSVTIPANLAGLKAVLDVLSERFAEMDILIGGQALEHDDECVGEREALLAKYKKVHYLGTLEALHRYAHRSP